MLPTKSAIAGMCCAALGIARGNAKEQSFLQQFAVLRMTTIAIPRIVSRRWPGASSSALAVRRLQDYHTVQNTRKAEGGLKDCHITYRQYLTDAAFGVVLEGGTDFVEQIAAAIADPKWGIWLGRKACLPTAPILAGLSDTAEAAWKLLIGDEPLASFTRQEEADIFAEGRDTLLDLPLCFASDQRLFAPRRVNLIQGSS
jgi:CRISPR system Cascade subunit CasD